MESKTILIVDDEDSVLFVLKNSLARLATITAS
jgi:CheY-like chemotaxis protein